MDLGTLMPFVVPALAAAAAWGGSRQALNGTRERVRGIDNKLDRHLEIYHNKHEQVVARIAANEAKLDAVKARIDICQTRRGIFEEK